MSTSGADEEIVVEEEIEALAGSAQKLEAENTANPGKHATREKVAALLSRAKDYAAGMRVQRPQPLAKILDERKEKLVEAFELDDAKQKKLDEWIDLANKAERARIGAKDAPHHEKKAAEKAHWEAKENFDKAIREGRESNDADLAKAAGVIKDTVKNHNGREEALDNLSKLGFPEDKSFAQMNEGELLGEIIFRLLALLLGGLKLLYSCIENDKEIDRSLDSALKQEGGSLILNDSSKNLQRTSSYYGADGEFSEPITGHNLWDRLARAKSSLASMASRAGTFATNVFSPEKPFVQNYDSSADPSRRPSFGPEKKESAVSPSSSHSSVSRPRGSNSSRK